MSDSSDSTDSKPVDVTHAECILPVGLGSIASEMGATVGAVAGPVGIVAGAVVGGVAGMVVGMVANEALGTRENYLRNSDD